MGGIIITAIITGITGVIIGAAWADGITSTSAEEIERLKEEEEHGK